MNYLVPNKHPYGAVVEGFWPVFIVERLIQQTHQ